MQESDEQDTCRICSAPAEPDLPLFHPCKCSGTIRYIHQDCLTTWLAHSKKKNCDLCKHPYSFTKVYASDMPKALPLTLLLKRIVHQIVFAILFGLRAIAVAIMWLAVLPWATIWTWRLYFSMGESTAWWISDYPRPPASSDAPNAFYKSVPSPVSLSEAPSFYTRLVMHPYWLALSADIFAGQIIASLIVLTFVAVFLLREWISQNARPGVFEDEDLIIDDFLPPRQIEPPQPLHMPHIIPPPDQNPVDIPPAVVGDPIPHDQVENPAPPYAGDTVHTDRPLKRGRGDSNAGQRLQTDQNPLEIQEGRAHLRRRLGQANPDAEVDVSPSASSLLPPGHEDGKFDFTFSLASSPPTQPSSPLPSFRPLGDSWSQVDPSQEDYPQDSSFSGAIAGPGPSTTEQLQRADEDLMQHWLAQGNTDTEPARTLEEYNHYYAPVPDSHKGKGLEFPKSDDEEEEEEGEDEGILSQDENWGGGEAELPEAEIHDVFAPQIPVVLEGVANGGGPPLQNDNAGPQPGAAANPPPDAAAPDLNEDLEGNVEDDMEGAMEAIGMRGPIYGVLQNAALMIFVLDTAIGLCVWLPFTIGKSTALLCLNPHRLLQILHLPIRAMRLITDPVVDAFFYLLVEYMLPPVFRLIRHFIALLFIVTVRIIDLLFGSEKSAFIVDKAAELVEEARYLQEEPLGYILSWTHSVPGVKKASPAATSWLDSAFPEPLNFTEPYFAALGREVRLAGEQLRAAWLEMALGSTPSDRAFATILGYSVVGLSIAIYLNILTVGNAKSAGRAVRSAVRQQLLVLKVAGFIFIELVLFPLGCGIVLDLCTVWLFPEANLTSRATFFFQAPLTAMFYHWVAGTMFMYTFAILLSGCRSVMRPGAMWFIKDPQDQNSHPIRDILDRPTLTQLRKIFVSGLMYSFVVACVVGSVAGLLLLGSKSIMPFRWKNREPLSNVPVDLLFLHFVLPYTVHYFRPKKAVKHLTTMLWRYLAKNLRLTSYFFGERHPDEEYTTASWFSAVDLEPTPRVNDGSFRRVPATDNLALPRDIRATALVHENGEPADEAARQLIQIQNAEAEKAKRSVKDDYMIVYIPPHFRWRILCFIVALWIIGAAAVGVVVALPIQFGRSFFQLFTDRDMHDGYSIIVGFYLLWGCYLVGKAIDRLDKRRQRTGGDGPRGDLRIFVVKRGLLWLAKTVYMVTFLGVIIPTLLALVIDLYVLLPFRFLGDPAIIPRIRMVDMWALGLLYAKIALHLPQVQYPPRIAAGIQHIRNNGWTHQDPIAATKEVIGPVVVGLLGMILVPGTAYRIMHNALPPQFIDDKTIFTRVYPGIFVLGFFFRSTSGFYDFVASWSQSIRDKEFLVEMRLRNHEPESGKGSAPISSNLDAMEALEVNVGDP
ncbi:hypothetical protein BDN72DRAFT_964036 [Pluteus cervinus]|uniref:Uncharacterized protein n=1 Tax=Pluteus cervinus TaxID=181527 RepID=A0ACD3ACM8_9AGAR|nr:hypothetical protein BDN72DRAFT_964036 [Pluteus cervinus]